MSRPTKYHDLLDAAEIIVRRDGSSSLTLDAVAAEAGVSKGGLLYHFPSKDALIAAMVERMVDRASVAHENAMLADSAGPGSWTRAWVRTSVSGDGPSVNDTTAAGLLAAVATHPALADPMRARYSEWRGKAEADGLPGEVASIVMLAADGLWMADVLGLSAPTGPERGRIIAALMALASPTPIGVAATEASP